MIMEGLEKLEERILKDAREEAKGVVEAAREEVQRIIKEAERKAEERREELLVRSRREADERARRILLHAESEARLEAQRVKEEVIEEVFKEARAALGELSDEDYLEWLEGMILALEVSGDEELVLSVKDRERIGDILLTRVNSALRERGVAAGLRLSDQTRDISGGFILVGPELEVNASFEALMSRSREELAPEVGKLLFGSEGDDRVDGS